MATAAEGAALAPVTAIALVGVLGVGAQLWAWRLNIPAIVLMLAAGFVVGPLLGLFDPARDIGPLMTPMVAIAVAIILFEGGLTLNFHSLRDAAHGVVRLVVIGAPLGWLMSALALHYGAGLSWQTSAVFGGIMIVTGPTVIAPLLRGARLSRRPAQLLQWEAILNDPIGALAAVLAFSVVQVIYASADGPAAALQLVLGIAVAGLVGAAGGWLIVQGFRRGWVPEYIKVPLLFVAVLAAFALSDAMLHESGLLAVTVMGIWIANSDLPSFVELRRFKEHATVLLVSGVFILLTASLDLSALGALTWRAVIFVALVVLVARPVTVLLSLLGTDVPWRERLLVAFTGPRGIVLVAVAGLFGERLQEIGIDDAALVGPLAFVLVSATVVLHGFTLAPMARLLGVAASERPGVLLVGGSNWATALAEALKKAEVPVLISDANHLRLRPAREVGVPTFYGDILSEAAEHNVELTQYDTVISVSDNDAYNTLVTSDLAPEFGRDNVFQIRREGSETARHALPASLGGRPFAQCATYREMAQLHARGWEFRVTGLTEEYGIAQWREDRPEARVIALIDDAGNLRFPCEESEIGTGAGLSLVHFSPAKKERQQVPPDA
ncbi:cation:proton antiporter [Lutimaribacter sp. EGI FJ00015]|uniref:Cation:proton antiporter n=1 Tax=Lutimaribacter degradans TaxID=2945989 RepID=A0ACC5ZX42_9RHOB|nr:sodium:proton antiporter [Lutimaribacter sp. EGI FJ00013]MCM2562415.1 cation:proton antiporter [Lutimaribacter sp. EGI FJ00013]MCO0613572.1 cation:proton antiporter [Lutimaribacter sp. EGI FJ00015]MCO0636544.1 cation:proton antiporter [Lutimaribacter sp. EGI FJ00014]